jgi:hypothetical protein
MFRSRLKQFLAVSVVAAATLAAACSSGPTPYQPAAGYDRGYSEQKIESERYRISFKGNSFTRRDTVENYLLYRAAELTLQSGFDTFTIVSRDTDRNSAIRRTGGYSGFSYMYFSPRWGWMHAWDPFMSSPARHDEVTRYEAYAEIVMSRGPKGSDANAFDARQVSQNLAASIQRPVS